MNGREAAWDAVHEALPARWAVGPPTYDPGVVRTDGQLGAFSVTARGPHPGRGKHPETVTGTGEDEVSALRDVEDQLLDVPQPDGGRMNALRRRLRLAYVEGGAEAWGINNRGRIPTSEELGRAIERFQA
jgi:hypothetical protein